MAREDGKGRKETIPRVFLGCCFGVFVCVSFYGDLCSFVADNLSVTLVMTFGCV